MRRATSVLYARARAFALGLGLGLVLVHCNADARRDEGTTPPPVTKIDGSELLVTLDRNGVVVISGRRLLLDDDIQAALTAFRERSPRGRVLIAAHRATLHGRLVRVVDLAKVAQVPFEITVTE